MHSYDELFKKIVAEGYDYGTGSWAYLCDDIVMRLNEFGEYVPEKKKKIIKPADFKNIVNSTPSLNTSPNETMVAKELFGDIKNIKFDSRIGYYSGLYAGYVKEGEYRENGSSGGFGSWILKELLEKKEIDKVIHVKESLSDKSILFEYQISDSFEEINKGAKTKYYPVEFSEVMKIVRETPGKYAIVGVPSFIMSFHLLSKIDAVLKERIVYTIGLVCGHQKTAKFSEYLAWQCGIEPGNLKYVNFRKKDICCTADNYNIEFVGTIDGKETKIEKKMIELNGRNWGQGFFKVRASDFTDDVMNETADITLGDAWLPEYTNDPLGTNIVIIRNPKIQEIINSAIKEKKIIVKNIDKEKIVESQSAHYRHTFDELPYRLQKKKDQNKWYPIKRIEPNKNIKSSRKKIQDLREEICFDSKKYYKEAVQKNDIDYFENKMKPLTKKYDNLYKIENYKKMGLSGITKRIYNKIFN